MVRPKNPDFATGKPVDFSKPEEPVRQEYEQILVDSYGYRKSEIDIEVKIPRGSGYFSDKADIVVYTSEAGRDPTADILGIVEVKKPTRRDGIEQLKSYMTATSAQWGVWTNKNDIAYLYRKGTKITDEWLNNIPVRGQSVEDVGRLKKSDLKPFLRGELRSVFRRALQRLYSNAVISRREKLGNEMIKIIFSKIEDEQTYRDRPPEFRAEAGEEPKEIAKRIRGLFGQVRKSLEHDGIFKTSDDIELDDKSLAWVVGQLERGSLLDTDSDVVGDAFEEFSEARFVGEKGEFFTPRGVVRVAVKLADPKPEETVCDPACGSGGFLIYAMKHIWQIMENDPRWRKSPGFTGLQRQMAMRCLFGIDKEIDLVKIAKAHMAIAGDGRSNIVHENSLLTAADFSSGAEKYFCEGGGGFRRFDVILTNPPFGSKTKILKEDSKHFDLGHKWQQIDGAWRRTDKAVNRDPYVLFIERCMTLLKSGGVLAIVLPETVFHAPTLGYVRQYLLNGNSIQAIIDLPHNTFRPHCNAKTCLLVLKKGAPQQDRIILATPEEMGHDHKGRDLYRRGTNILWDDLSEVVKELDDPNHPNNKNVFSIPWSAMNPDVLVPRYYRRLHNPPAMPDECRGVVLRELIEEGVVKAIPGHGSPEAKYKGKGDIPYIRVSDIVNWELYRNPVSGIPEAVYRVELGKNGVPPEAGDVVFVWRGSYRIGTVAMASPRDRKVLLTKELVMFRVVDPGNQYGITPFYLLYLLSLKMVQNQIKHLVFIDTTLPTIHERWNDLVLPVHSQVTEVNEVSDRVERAIKEKWSAQGRIDQIREDLGGLVT